MEHSFSKAYEALYQMGKERDANMAYTSYAFILTDPDTTFLYPNSGCFGKLRDGLKSLKEARGRITYFCFLPCPEYAKRISNIVLSPEEKQTYLNWVVHESHWAPVFLNKNENNYESTGVIGDANFPANLLIGGMEAIRAYYDMPELVLNWLELVKRGVQKDLAFITAFCIWFSKDYQKFFYNSMGVLAAHSPIDPSIMTNSMLKAFLEHKNVWLSPDPFYKKTDYNGIHAVWGADAWFNNGALYKKEGGNFFINYTYDPNVGEKMRHTNFSGFSTGKSKCNIQHKHFIPLPYWEDENILLNQIKTIEENFKNVKSATE